jgi:flagellar protein FliS
MTYPTQRNRFLDDAVATASPARLLTMLYDRLVLDLHRAEAAQRDGHRAESHDQLTHAQDIVSELLSTLDVEAWDGAPGLASLYGHLLKELVRANINGDADLTASCRELVEPLRDAWHEASRTVATPTLASVTA